MEELAELAAEKAVKKLTATIYQEIGKNVLAKLFWIVGALCAGFFLWLKGKGLLD